MTKEKQFLREKESPLALGSLTQKKNGGIMQRADGKKRIKQKQE